MEVRKTNWKTNQTVLTDKKTSDMWEVFCFQGGERRLTSLENRYPLAALKPDQDSQVAFAPS